MTGRLVRERTVAAERLLSHLQKPFEAPARADGCVYSDDEFDPWALFPGIFGGYSSDFDKCAIDVLTELRDKTKRRTDLGAEMFREMLCVQEFCDYGTSPRGCFWQLDCDLLDQLIAKWQTWSEAAWKEGRE